VNDDWVNDNPSGPLPPQDNNAEQAVLGSMLIEPGAALIGLRLLEPTDFYLNAHQILFAAMERAHGDNLGVDLITVCSKLRERSEMEQAGGAEYLTAVINSVPTAAHVGRYCNIVLDNSRRRQAITIAAELQADLYAGRVKPEDGVARFLPMHEHKGMESGDVRAMAVRHWTWLEDYVNQDPQPEIPLLGIPGLDRKLGGLGRQEVVVLKAEEKFGKTTLLRQSLLETARALRDRGEPGVCLYYNLEGTMTSWLSDAISYLGKVDRAHLRHGGLHSKPDWLAAEAWQAIAAAEQELSNLPVILKEFVTNRRVETIVADVLYHQCRQPLRGVWIDYIQRLQAKGRDKTAQVMEASSQLVDIFRRTGAPVITASQVTRKDSGETSTWFAAAVQMDASLVLQLDRGKLGEKRGDVARGSREGRIINTHARYSESVGATELWFQGEFARFVERDDTRG